LTFLKRILRAPELGIFVPLVILCALVALNNAVFLSLDNLLDVLRNTSYILIIAVGMTFVLIGGGLDLSVGSFLAFCGLICGIGLKAGWPIPAAIMAGLAVGVVGGLLNALVIVRLSIPPLITTLGTLYMARGLVLVVTRGTPVYPLPDEFSALGNGYLFGIPSVVIVALAVSLAGAWTLKHTVFGREVYAIGGNEETARFSGISVRRVKTAIYVIVTVLAALSGVLMTARLGSAQPGIGDGYEMQVITAVIIGGTSLAGGSGTILGTVLGALFMSVLANGMNLIGVSVYWQKFVMGAIIIIAVGTDHYRRTARRSR
jgi:ribose/xylose/arabinose/galactoside ABC-type transport system permease subunit